MRVTLLTRNGSGWRKTERAKAEAALYERGGISQRKLAAIFGVSLGTMSTWVEGVEVRILCSETEHRSDGHKGRGPGTRNKAPKAPDLTRDEAEAIMVLRQQGIAK